MIGNELWMQTQCGTNMPGVLRKLMISRPGPGRRCHRERENTFALPLGNGFNMIWIKVKMTVEID